MIMPFESTRSINALYVPGFKHIGKNMIWGLFALQFRRCFRFRPSAAQHEQDLLFAVSSVYRFDTTGRPVAIILLTGSMLSKLSRYLLFSQDNEVLRSRICRAEICRR
jgi:hypothetical protein